MNRKKYSNIMLRIEMAIASSMLGSFVFEQTLFLTFIHYVSHFTDLLKIRSVDAMRKMFEFKREFDEFKSGKKLLNYDTIFNFLKTI